MVSSTPAGLRQARWRFLVQLVGLASAGVLVFSSYTSKIPNVGGDCGHVTRSFNMSSFFLALILPVRTAD